jgi:hypothetical protein
MVTPKVSFSILFKEKRTVGLAKQVLEKEKSRNQQKDMNY